MNSAILWAVSFTLFKLVTKNLHLVTRIIFSSCLPKGDMRIFSISTPARTIKITPKVVLWMSEVLVNHKIFSKIHKFNHVIYQCSDYFSLIKIFQKTENTELFFLQWNLTVKFAENMTVLITMWRFLEGVLPPPVEKKTTTKQNIYSWGKM